jgi:hypothetical protein
MNGTYLTMLPHIQGLRGIRSVGVCSMDAAVEPPGMADICSCNICISYIPVGRFTAALGLNTA